MTIGKLRVAFVSAVRHAGPYAEIFQDDPRVEIVGMGDEPGVPEWIASDGQLAAAEAGTRWHDDLDGWLNPDNVDLAVICSEPTRHARLAIEMLGRGISVLVDKPVAVTVEEADAVAAAVTQSGRNCYVVNRTHAPALRELRRWVDEGRLGLPRHLDMEFFASGAYFSSSVERPELVVDSSLSGGGEIMNFLGYCIDAIRYISGLEVASVFAMTGNLFLEPHATHDVEDVAVISLGLDQGVTATVTVGRIPFAPGLGPTSSSLRVLGSHGHAIADDDRPALEHFGEAGLSARPLDGGQQALRAYLEHVVAAALANRPSDYGIEEARESIAVIGAAYRSAVHDTVEKPN